MGIDLIAVGFLFFLGLAVGSHVNVIVLRYGFVETSSVRSACAQCGETIHWFDLIPVLSYLALDGHCRACGSALAVQYPVVELLLASLFALMYIFYTPAFTVLGLLQFASLLAFWSALVALVVYDIRHTLIPLPFVVWFSVFAFMHTVITALTLEDYYPLVDSFAGALILSGFFYGVHWITRGKGMGIGDAYVAIGIGLLLGVVQGITAVVLGVWAATLVYVLLYLLPKVGTVGGIRVTMKTELPFAPWLALGTFLAMTTELSPFWIGERIMNLWIF